METKPIRIGEWTLKEIREIGKEFGSPADDAILRQIVEGYKRQKVVIENLELRLNKCEEKREKEE